MAKVKTGVVVSNNMQKTVVVRIDRMVPHKKYSKRYRVSTRLSVHDEANSAQIGQTVAIRETRPMSKTKHWEIVPIEAATSEAPKKRTSKKEAAT